MKKFIMTVVVGAALATAASVSAATFVYPGYVLKPVARGSVVADLQTCLNTLGYNAGAVDGIYGNMTKAAVMQYQAAKGLVADGLVGPMTGAKLNIDCAAGSTSGSSMNLPEGCTSTAGYSPLTGEKCDGSTSGSSMNLPEGCIAVDNPMYSPINGQRCVASSDSNSGSSDDNVSFDGSGDEASFTAQSMSDADDTTIEEGAHKAELGSFEFKNEDSAVKLEKFDAILSSTTAASASDEDDAWKVFKKLYLYVDGDLVASKDVEDRGEWRDRTISDPTIVKDVDNRIRFSGLNKVLSKNDTHKVVLKADIAPSVDMDASGAEWAWVVDETALRFMDEAGITHYLTEDDVNNEEVANFTIVKAGAQDELQVKSSTADPEATTFEVKDTQSSDDYLAFAFDVKADADGSDIEISKFQLSANTGTANFDKVVDEVTLKIDGKEVDYDRSASTGLASTNATLVFDFDGKEVTIPAGDTKTAKVYVRFKSKNGGSNYADGETIQFMVTGTDVDAWDSVGEDDLTTAQLTGSSTGEVHSLYEKGVIVTMDSSNVSAAADNGKTTKITYTINLKVKAFGDTAYFNTSAVEADNPGASDVIAYRFEDGNGNAVAAANTTATEVVTTTASPDGSAYRIDDGSEETVTLKVFLTDTTTVNSGAGTPTPYRIQLKKLQVFKDAALTPAQKIVTTLLPEQDYETATELLEA